MPGSVDHCWITSSVCTNGDFDPLCKGIHISDWWHRVYIEIWGTATCHARPAVSITFKDSARFQIVLQNPYMKLAVEYAFIHSPINCICDIDFLWSTFPVAIVYSLSTILLQKWEGLASSFNAYFIQNSYSLYHSLHVFWAIVLLTIILLHFMVYVLKLSRYILIGN